jgi:predicted signal transduction protein with EAL and GGDEF domain
VSGSGSFDPASNSRSPASEAEFLEAVRGCIEARRESKRHLAILLIETGITGGIDAVWGYQMGDAVRDRVSAALRAEVLRAEDPLGEMGRGRLAFALTSVDDPSVALLAAEKSLRVLSTPLLVGEDEIYARPAIGIAMWPTHGDDPETLLQHARTGCQAARADASHIAMYAEHQVNSGATQFLYQNRLRSAVTDDTLDLVFQPQYDLRRGNVMGAEGVFLSPDPRLGLVPAVDAFAAAEFAGLVSALMSSQLNRALRNCSEFRYSAGLDLRIGVNVPARALVHAEVADIVERALRTWGLRAGRLVLEISETSRLASDPAARETLGRLHDIGVRLAIDDPGLPLSSLFWLAAMPFRTLKIDVSKATRLGNSAQPARIMQSMVELAHHLNFDVFAVGVADEAAENCLKEIGCDYMQSDRKGPPLEAQAFVKNYGLV